MLEILNLPVYQRKNLGKNESNWIKDLRVMRIGKRDVVVRAKEYSTFVEEHGTLKSALCPRLVHFDELFDLILESHKEIEHGKSEKTWVHASKKYTNISKEMCKMFCLTCPRCVNSKHKTPGRKVELNPILSNTLNDRGQMDLIDMQATPDGEFKWILHYQDNLTKFSYLRALRQKSKFIIISFRTMIVLKF